MKEMVTEERLWRILEALPGSREARGKSMSLIHDLRRYDPYHATSFEFSFKAHSGMIAEGIRFLNMDHNGYSCASPKWFMRRLNLHRQLMKRHFPSGTAEEAVRTLMRVSRTPMDLYFGADVSDDSFLFGFWLILGGVKKDGKATFWPYDAERIITDVIGADPVPGQVKGKVLNIGLDISPGCMKRKIYYLMEEGQEYGRWEDSIREDLGRAVTAGHFFFMSEMYDHRGKAEKKKVFIEFLEEIRGDSISAVLSLLNGIQKASFPEETAGILNHGRCRISLISFEEDGTATIYMRPD